MTPLSAHFPKAISLDQIREKLENDRIVYIRVFHKGRLLWVMEVLGIEPDRDEDGYHFSHKLIGRSIIHSGRFIDDHMYASDVGVEPFFHKGKSWYNPANHSEFAVGQEIMAICKALAQSTYSRSYMKSHSKRATVVGVIDG